MKKTVLLSLALVMLSLIISACGTQNGNEEVEKQNSDLQDNEKITSSNPEQAPSQSNSLEGEFVAINVYNVTSIDHYRAIMKDNGDLVLLTSFETPYQKAYSLDTGLLSIINFYIKENKIKLDLDTNGYAVGAGGLQEIYLDDAQRNIYVGHSGIRISLTGEMITVTQATLQGLEVFSVTGCEIIE